MAESYLETAPAETPSTGAAAPPAPSNDFDNDLGDYRIQSALDNNTAPPKTLKEVLHKEIKKYFTIKGGVPCTGNNGSLCWWKVTHSAFKHSWTYRLCRSINACSQR